MEVNEEQLIQNIDKMSYREMLTLWRNTPVGSPYFTGKVGAHFTNVMEEKRAAMCHSAVVAVSKAIGWEGER